MDEMKTTDRNENVPSSLDGGNGARVHHTRHVSLGMKNAAREWDRCRMDYRPAAAAVSSSYTPASNISETISADLSKRPPGFSFSSPMSRGRGGRENVQKRNPE